MQEKVRRHPGLVALCEAILEDGRSIETIASNAGCTSMCIYNWLNCFVRCGRHEKMADVAAVLGLRWKLVAGANR